MTSRRDAGPRVLWAGVVVKLDDGRTLALEFDSVNGFITADVHTVQPWNGGHSKLRDDVRVTVQGNGLVWSEGVEFAEHRRVNQRELEAPRRALGDGAA